MISSRWSNQQAHKGYLVTQENLNILKQLNRKASDATIHCALLSEYRNGIIQRIRSRPNQSNRFIHSLKYKCLSLESRKQNGRHTCNVSANHSRWFESNVGSSSSAISWVTVHVCSLEKSLFKTIVTMTMFKMTKMTAQRVHVRVTVGYLVNPYNY